MAGHKPSGIPLRMALLYFLFAGFYIFVSDQILMHYISDPAALTFFQTYKGWGFVAVTALLLYFLLKAHLQQLLLEVNERRRAAEAEKLAAKHWQKTFDASIDAICLVDTEKNILRVNRAMANLAEVNQEDLPGQKCCAVIHEEPDSFDNCPLLDTYNLVERKEAELQLKGRWYIASVDPVFNESGELQYAVHILRDISDRKQAEENIRSQRDALSSLHSLSTIMRTASSTDDLLSLVLNESCRLLEADNGTVMRLSQDRKYFTIVKAEGLWVAQVGYEFPATKGLCSKVLQTGKPYITDNYSDEEKELYFLNQTERTGPMVLVPLKTEAETIGVLEVSRRRYEETRLFTTADVELLSAIGEMAGNALRHQVLFESAQKRLKQLQGLRNIDKAISGSLDLNLIFDVILNEVTTLLNLDAAAILRFDHKTGIIEYSACRGFLFEKGPQLELRWGEGYAGRAVKGQRLIEISNLKKVDMDPVQGPLLEEERFVSYYAIPLITKGYVQGVLEVYQREEQELDQEWLDFLKALAGQTAIAIDNADLFQGMETANLELIQAYDATIEGWAYALDLKDEETEAHSQRVTRLALRIAKRMNIKKEELPHIKRGVLLHDIGKMGIPDSILLKPGPLTEDEWAVMHRHPVYAYEMLSRIDYLRPALDIPYCHHEKWDGSGYPRGLRGEEIPLPARIFAVVDVYDALTSDRPYRKAWSEKDTLALIKKESGSHFDPAVVEEFFKEIEDSS